MTLLVDHVREAQTMVPPVELRPDTLPTDRLLVNGKAVPEVRAELRRIPNLRNVGNVLSVWAQSFGLIALACWISHPVMWVATFVLMGRAFA